MTVESIDVGFVSHDRVLVDFLAEVLELEELAPLVFPQGIVHRLQGPAGLLKVMVPTDAPAAPPTAAQFTAIAGLRYITVWVTDLDAATARATARGGVVVMGPTDLRPGVRLAVLNDPDGNAIEVIEQS